MKLTSVILLCIVLSSCSSILNDKNQNINVVSSNNTPIEGKIGLVPFKGPGIVPVERAKQDKIIMVNNKKCVQQTLLKSSVDSTFWINILSGGTFGSTTDYSSEKMWAYQDTVIIQCS